MEWTSGLNKKGAFADARVNLTSYLVVAADAAVGRPPLSVFCACFFSALASWVWVMTVESVAPDALVELAESSANAMPATTIDNTAEPAISGHFI
jgi:hypothetical protein